MTSRPYAVAALVAATAAALVSCSPQGGGEDAAVDPVAAAASSLRAAGADQSQIDVFTDGSVTYEEYESAMNRAFDCQRELGATVTVIGTKMSGGVTVLDYTLQPSDAAMDALDECYTTFAGGVDAYWQASSPTAVSFADRRAVALLQPLRDCLSRHDVDWSEDESFNDLRSRAIVGIGADSSDPDGYDCLNEIQYADWQG